MVSLTMFQLKINFRNNFGRLGFDIGFLERRYKTSCISRFALCYLKPFSVKRGKVSYNFVYKGETHYFCCE